MPHPASQATMTNQPTQRFSNRVQEYIQYRPGYPAQVLTTLQNECHLTSDSWVVDVGSGTGILSELFLRKGNQVVGVEPNREMRQAGERLLQGYSNFHSVNGTAEATTLPAASADFVTAGQAFHWFDRAKTKTEFVRILKPNGWVVLIWNERLTHTSRFLLAYEQLLLTYATDYRQVNHKQIDHQVLLDFFAPHTFQKQVFANRQNFDFAGLKGRLLSSSYAPVAGHPQHSAMLAELQNMFTAHQVGGTVGFDYQTQLYWGRLG
ncbi:MAG TPA: class I SAM-dependent methyltransferase [Anaerolineales bacterium]|nr:class I SAM-dependent methyltransferase [Anaerolineales bacterium]